MSVSGSYIVVDHRSLRIAVRIVRVGRYDDCGLLCLGSAACLANLATHRNNHFTYCSSQTRKF